MVKIENFVKEYTKAITEGYAAIFAGAGLSRSSGYIDWKNLLKPMAEEIGLDVEKENDLVAVAQYYRNAKGNRNQINQAILNNFTAETKENKNVNIITELPISTYWTTNYDCLIEEGLKSNNRKADVKVTEKNLSNNICDRDAVVYKMHGDVRDPDNAVLTKDDYDKYGVSHSLFRTALRGDLISKTFLFIGFSFEDPNLDYIISSIKVLLDESVRDHYCILRKVCKSDYDDEQRFIYDSVKQDLRIKDLQRYGIQTILIDDFREITSILLKIKRCCLLKNIFVSGSSAAGYLPSGWDETKFSNFLFKLGRSLVEKGYKIVSGFGLGVGSLIVNGALEEIMSSKYKHLDDYLSLRPFPQIAVGSVTREELWQQYREDIIDDVGIVIFLFGNKLVDGKIINANGVLQEFGIAKQKNKYVIPVGGTGGASELIYAEVQQHIDEYSYLKDFLDVLSTADPEKLTQAILEIINNIGNIELNDYREGIYVEKTSVF